MLTSRFTIWLQDPGITPVWTGVKLVDWPQYVKEGRIEVTVEGNGYDLHWDVRFDCNHEMEFSWEEEPKRFEWSQGDFVYIPPYCTHKHFNSDPKHEARIIVINSRIVKAMGFNWFDQIENAEGY